MLVNHVVKSKNLKRKLSMLGVNGQMRCPEGIGSQFLDKDTNTTIRG